MKPKSCVFEIENSCVKWARKRKKDRKKQEYMSLNADTDLFALPGPLRRAASTRTCQRWLCFVLRWEDAAGERLTFILFLVLPVLPLSPRGMNLLNPNRETCSHRERRERRQ